MAGTERMRLTDAGIARLRPREREYTIWDTRIAGLGVRVRPSGGASFILLRKADVRSRRLSLGSVTSRRVDDIRRDCHSLMATRDSNTTTEISREVPPFRDFVAGRWKETHFPRYKPSTRSGVNAALANQLMPAFGSTPLDRITRNHVLRWFDAYSQLAPGGANHALHILRQILNFAIACDHIGVNPARGVKVNRRTALTRFLSREELRRLHHALDEHSRESPGSRQQVEIIRLLLLTGCRRGEILTLRWCEVDRDTLTLGDSKTGSRKVHLNAQAAPHHCASDAR